MATTLRSYGPGKFNTVLDAYVYEATLDGPDEQCGDVETIGWYGLLRGPIEAGSLGKLDWDTEGGLTHAEALWLADNAKAGVIVYENSQGFVSVDYINDRGVLAIRWDAIERGVEAYEEEQSYCD